MSLGFRENVPARPAERDAGKKSNSLNFAIRGTISSRSDFTIGMMGIGILVALWCIATYGGVVRSFYLPTPTRVWEGLADFHRRQWLLLSIWRSFWRVIRGLNLVIVVGVPVGILMGTFASVDALLRKMINGVKGIPAAGGLGLVVLWFSTEESAKIAFIFLIAIFYMILMVRNAILAVNEDYLSMALDFGATRWQVVWRILLPGAFPRIWDATIECCGIMWAAVVVVEFINSSEAQLGLGYLLYFGARTQDSGKVFAALLTFACASSLSDFYLHLIRQRFFNW